MRKLVFVVLCSFALFASGCAGLKVSDPLEESHSLVYGFVDVYEINSTVASFPKPVFKSADTGESYTGSVEKNSGLIWHDSLPPSTYRLESFYTWKVKQGGMGFSKSLRQVRPNEYGDDPIKFAVKKGGLYYFGSFSAEEEDMSFLEEAGKAITGGQTFKMVREKKDHEATALDMLLDMSDGSYWAPIIEGRIDKVNKKKK